MEKNTFKRILTVFIAVILLTSLTGCSSKPFTQKPRFLKYAKEVSQNSFRGGKINSVYKIVCQNEGDVWSFKMKVIKDNKTYHFTFSRSLPVGNRKYKVNFYNKNPQYETMELLLEYLKVGDNISIASSKPLDQNVENINFKFLFLEGEKIPHI